MPFKDREKARVSANKYLNTESGFMVAKWCDISKKFNKAEKLARGETQEILLGLFTYQN